MPFNIVGVCLFLPPSKIRSFFNGFDRKTSDIAFYRNDSIRVLAHTKTVSRSKLLISLALMALFASRLFVSRLIFSENANLAGRQTGG